MQEGIIIIKITPGIPDPIHLLHPHSLPNAELKQFSK